MAHRESMNYHRANTPISLLLSSIERTKGGACRTSAQIRQILGTLEKGTGEI